MSNKDIAQTIKDKLIVALDVPSVDEAEGLVKTLDDSISFYKIGHRLAFSGGLDLAQDLIRGGKKIFLDLKLLDIDNTIENGVESVVELGVDMLTLHAYPKAMRAAVKAAKGSNLCLLGVTVLTSMDHDDLIEAGYRDDPKTLVMKRAQQAKDAGMGGIVASAQEAESIRQLIGDEMAIVTPGIRPTGSDKGDQKRVVTPKDALKFGASHLVVGRPIIAAQDPRAAALAILEEMAN